jgi:hypothetical protein
MTLATSKMLGFIEKINTTTTSLSSSVLYNWRTTVKHHTAVYRTAKQSKSILTNDQYTTVTAIIFGSFRFFFLKITVSGCKIKQLQTQ